MPSFLRSVERVEPSDTIFSIAIPASLKRDLRQTAHERGESMSAVARGILERELAAVHPVGSRPLRLMPLSASDLSPQTTQGEIRAMAPIFPRRWGRPPADPRDRRDWIKRNALEEQSRRRRGGGSTGSTADLKLWASEQVAAAYERAAAVIESMGRHS
jgi:hypothetical protein